MTALGLTPAQFWQLTPTEFWWLFSAHQERIQAMRSDGVDYEDLADWLDGKIAEGAT